MMDKGNPSRMIEVGPMNILAICSSSANLIYVGLTVWNFVVNIVQGVSKVSSDFKVTMNNSWRAERSMVGTKSK
jgi:hypothetical protein